MSFNRFQRKFTRALNEKGFTADVATVRHFFNREPDAPRIAAIKCAVQIDRANAFGLTD